MHDMHPRVPPPALSPSPQHEKEEEKKKKKKVDRSMLFTKNVILISSHHKVMSKERNDGDKWNIRYSLKTSIHDKYPSPEREFAHCLHRLHLVGR